MRVVLAFLAVVLPLGGCDNIFRLTPVPEPTTDGGTTGDDGDMGDAAVDAFLPGCPANYIAAGDYDNDGRPNNTDLCPQLTNAQVDSDSDGVGDQCDRHPSTPGDCIVFLDEFATLDCWRPYEAWGTCAGNRPCTPAAGATLDLRLPIALDTAELRGTFEQTASNGPSVLLMMNDSQPNAAVTGDACELVNLGGHMGTAVKIYAANTGVSSNTVTNTPQQTASEVPMDMVLAWGVQTQSLPNYMCVGYTATVTVPISSGTQYPSTVPSGSQPVIRTSNVRFVPKAFIGYGVGDQCSDSI